MKRKPQDQDDIDWRAAVLRLEAIVEALQTCHVCDGWKLDKRAAKRALGYLRRHADNPVPDVTGESDVEGLKALVAFAHEHGQSLDYIFCDDAVSMACMLASHSPRAQKIAA